MAAGVSLEGASCPVPFLLAKKGSGLSDPGGFIIQIFHHHSSSEMLENFGIPLEANVPSKSRLKCK